MATREPAKHIKASTFKQKADWESPLGSISKRIKSIWKTAGRPGSLKSYVASQGGEFGKLKDAWLHNKRANFSKSPQGIGHTRGRKGKK